MPISRHADCLPYITKDGSIIRELMHPDQHGNTAQSLAEATLPPGTSTALHRHLRAEEIYYFIAGHGTMKLGDATFAVAAGDTVCIPPGTAHGLSNPSQHPLVLLCGCSPAYSHADTELL